MLRWSRWRGDAGTASLEFITAGALLLVPMVYLVVTLGAIQSAALAAEGGARQSARVFVLSDSLEAGREAIERAIGFALADHGVESADVAVHISCEPVPTECHTRQGFVTVTVDVAVPLPLVPPALGDLPLTVPIQATATQQVPRFWGSG